jgi:hypothetical protein
MIVNDPSPALPVNTSGAGMLHYVATGTHLYTIRSVAPGFAAHGMTLQTWAWADMLKAETLPCGLWVLTDFDRLPAWWIEVAAHRAGLLRAAGVPVLNDPRDFVHRAAFLRRMYRAGLNSFDCWCPALGEMPDRFPVFLRTILAHRGTLTDLLPDAAAAAAALQEARAAGHPVGNLVFIEYRAAADATGVFRKLAAYRVGDRIIPALSVNDRGWHAKYGTVGAASDAQYAAERAAIVASPHEDALRAAFEVAGATYGRADYAVVGGRVEVYEINTNPSIGIVREHPNPDRMESDRISRDRHAAALAALVQAGPPVPVPPDAPAALRQP